MALQGTEGDISTKMKGEIGKALTHSPLNDPSRGSFKGKESSSLFEARNSLGETESSNLVADVVK